MALCIFGQPVGFKVTLYYPFTGIRFIGAFIGGFNFDVFIITKLVKNGQRDGLIEIDEDDGTFEAVDENSKTWLHELQARFEKAGLSLSDLTMN